MRLCLLLLALAACGGGKKKPAATDGCDLAGTYRTPMAWVEKLGSPSLRGDN